MGGARVSSSQLETLSVLHSCPSTVVDHTHVHTHTNVHTSFCSRSVWGTCFDTSVGSGSSRPGLRGASATAATAAELLAPEILRLEPILPH